MLLKISPERLKPETVLEATNPVADRAPKTSRVASPLEGLVPVVDVEVVLQLFVKAKDVLVAPPPPNQ